MSNQHALRMKLHEHLRTVLRCATSVKPRDYAAEWSAVMTAANNWADKHEGCTRVTGDIVQRCDNLAAGHVDWVDKFPLYVSEHVYGIGRLDA